MAEYVCSGFAKRRFATRKGRTLGTVKCFLALVLALAVTGGISAAGASDKKGESSIQAAGKGQPEEVKRLLNDAADVDTKGENGMTALMEGSRKGHEPVAKLLLAKGVDVNAKADTGVTALKVATRKGRTEAIKLLKERGAKE